MNSKLYRVCFKNEYNSIPCVIDATIIADINHLDGADKYTVNCSASYDITVDTAEDAALIAEDFVARMFKTIEIAPEFTDTTDMA